MDYIELSCKIDPFTQVFADLLIADLGEIGYDSFTQELGEIKAYITEDKFDFDAAKNIDILVDNQFGSATLSYQKIETQNWNAAWESNFEPVVASNACIVRAPFHTPDQSYQYDIIIEPKMSFGTGHHQTTQLMMEQILQLDLENKTVADCGCGTGVLGILAHLKGAKEVYAFDYDDWAYQNTLENAERNNCDRMITECGTLELLDGKIFDVVIANINRNILIEGMRYISGATTNGVLVLFSGLFVEDLPILEKSANEYGLRLNHSQSKDNWICAVFTK